MILHEPTLTRQANEQHDNNTLWDDVEQTLPAVFEAVAAVFPDKKAVGSGHWQPTYRELNNTADHVAAVLNSQTWISGNRVAVLMSHDSPMLAAVLGILKAGGTFVVLNAANPTVRMKHIAADVDAALLITDLDHQPQALEVAPDRCKVLNYHDDILQAPAADGPATPQAEIEPGDAALLIYTSGTTGAQKGVIQNHRNILHSVRNYTLRLGYQSSDRICLLSTLDGGQGVMTSFCALLNGAALYPYLLRKKGTTTMVKWMIKHKISVFISAASIFRRFAEATPHGILFPHLRLVRLGAEAARKSDLETCRRLTSEDCLFAHVMSSSETFNITQFVCRVGDQLKTRMLPVGTPVSGKKLLLLDDSGNEVQDGQEGEIFVQSRYLSPGYWNDAQATARSFTTLTGSDERIYRTGDIGCRLEDGSLILLGRKDRQYKVLGNRINLREIESLICQVPEIEDAVVAMAGRPGEEEKLTAWYVSRACIEVDELRSRLQKLMPVHMIPARLESLAAIPYTSNGKPDMNALKLVEKAAPSGMEQIQPRTATEKRIAEIWRQVLGSSEVSIYQTIFEAGADSIQAMDMILRVSQELDVNLSATQIVHFPSIAQLADAYEAGHFPRVKAKEPFFRRIKASLLAIKSQGGGRPLLFIPGGACTENEVLVFARMAVLLPAQFSAYGARMNLNANRLLRPLSLRQLARKIGRAWLKENGRQAPVVIGECQASPLACEVALWLSSMLGTAPELILLDPWLPRTKPTNASEPVSPALARYYKLSQEAKVRSYPRPVHIICAKESNRTAQCEDWWSLQTGRPCLIEETPGDHHSYLRAYRAELAAAIARIVA